MLPVLAEDGLIYSYSAADYYSSFSDSIYELLHPLDLQQLLPPTLKVLSYSRLPTLPKGNEQPRPLSLPGTAQHHLEPAAGEEAG